MSVAGGGRLTSRLSAGVEVTWGPVTTSRQSIRVSGGSLNVDAKHRDTVLSAMVSVLAGRNETVRAAFVGTAGFALRNTSRTGTLQRIQSPSVPADVPLADAVPAVGGGLDVAIQVNNRIAFTPLVRLHYLLDDDGGPGQPPLRGVGSVLFVIGVGAQFQNWGRP